MKLWVCQVRREAFVGGESQRCRHSKTCEKCLGTGRYIEKFDCSVCNGTGQVSECGEMELIGGEPLEWCKTHASPGLRVNPTECHMRPFDEFHERCHFVSQIRVGP